MREEYTRETYPSFGKKYNDENVIVSMTSYGQRFSYVPKVIFSILNQTYKSIHIVLTVFKDDVKDIPQELQILINENVIELLVGDKNLRCHLKYFYCMKKYRNTPIITIDDDMIYYPNTIEDLYKAYKKYNCVCGRCCREMTFTNGKINEFKKWIWHSLNPKPSRRLHALGFSGVIYPPNALKISDDLITEINECLTADDIYLNVLEIRNNVLVKTLQTERKQINMIESKGVNALSDRQDNIKITNQYIKRFEKDFNLCH